MRILVSIAALLVSVNVFASPVTPDSDWSQIFSDRHSRVTANFDFAGQDLSNVCKNANNGLQTIEPVPVCLETERPIKCSPVNWPCETKCKTPAEVILPIPRDYSVKTCLKYKKPLNAHYPDCEVEGMVEYHIPDVINADVYRLTGNWGGESGNSYYSFTKPYSIPNCK